MSIRPIGAGPGLISTELASAERGAPAASRSLAAGQQAASAARRDQLTLSSAARALAKLDTYRPGEKFQLKLSPEELQKLVAHEGGDTTPATPPAPAATSAAARPQVARDLHPRSAADSVPTTLAWERQLHELLAEPALKSESAPADSSINQEEHHGH